MNAVRWYQTFEGAERYAGHYVDETGTTERVTVAEDLQSGLFAVVLGEPPTDDDRYVVLCEAAR